MFEARVPRPEGHVGGERQRLGAGDGGTGWSGRRGPGRPARPWVLRRPSRARRLAVGAHPLDRGAHASARSGRGPPPPRFRPAPPFGTSLRHTRATRWAPSRERQWSAADSVASRAVVAPFAADIRAPLCANLVVRLSLSDDPAERASTTREAEVLTAVGPRSHQLFSTSASPAMPSGPPSRALGTSHFQQLGGAGLDRSPGRRLGRDRAGRPQRVGTVPREHPMEHVAVGADGSVLRLPGASAGARA